MCSLFSSRRVPYGGIQGYADGVPAYSNGDDEHFSGKRSYIRLPPPKRPAVVANSTAAVASSSSSSAALRKPEEGPVVSTGYEWQCVEFARRWLLVTKGLMLPDVPTADKVFLMDRVKHISGLYASSSSAYYSSNMSVPMVAVPNGGRDKPVVGSLLIWPQARGAPFGHIAVIVAVGDGFIRIADQNQKFHNWLETGFSAELRLEYNGRTGAWTVCDRIYGRVWHPLGWMVFPSEHHAAASVAPAAGVFAT